LNPNPPRVVLFDIGGPIDMELRSEAAIAADIREGLALRGFRIDDAAYEEAERHAIETFAPSLYRSVIWRLAKGDEDAALAVYLRMEALAAARELFDLRPGMPELLRLLREKGLRLGLAANQPAKALQSLARHGIGDLFENQGVSGVYGYRKPDVRLFLRACEDLRVEPKDCLIVGDRIDNDIVPTKLLGIGTVLFRTGRHREQQARSWDELPDAEVTSVDGLERVIGEICGLADPAGH
jgi:HAD superfamily hydrolase (TIGR01549 family)